MFFVSASVIVIKKYLASEYIKGNYDRLCRDFVKAGSCASIYMCHEPRGLFIWLVIYSVHGLQPNTNTQNMNWIITPSLMVLSSSPARASSLLLLLLALPTLTSAVFSPHWQYFLQGCAGFNLHFVLYSTTLSWSPICLLCCRAGV